MKSDGFNKKCMTVGLVFLSITLFSAEAFPWGFATHAYIDGHIGRQYGIRNADELYGGLAPDIFAYAFELPYWRDINDVTHYDFMKLWDVQTNGVEMSLAFGFASHNNLWGADFSAHTLCLACGSSEGYVTSKARQLLAQAPLPPELGIPNDAAIEILHELVENGVDLLIKRADPLIGDKLSASALHRSPQFPSLIAAAYAADISALSGWSYPEAEGFIKAAEGEFRSNMVLYGQILTLEEEPALLMMSRQTSGLARQFLALYGVELPVSDEEILEMVEGYSRLAVSLCEYDYLQEIDAAIALIDDEMMARGIAY